MASLRAKGHYGAGRAAIDIFAFLVLLVGSAGTAILVVLACEYPEEGVSLADVVIVGFGSLLGILWALFLRVIGTAVFDIADRLAQGKPRENPFKPD